MSARPSLSGLRHLHTVAAALIGLAVITAAHGLNALAIASAVAASLAVIVSLERLRHAIATHRETRP